ncbi:MAG: hypothetical protein FJ291_32300 [Planctomycetes bacterium]|nr:hypothetical protein [Planctomycetota bacterium]
MRSGIWSLRRKLFVALLVMMTFLPLVVYLYSREQGRQEAAQRLTAHVERSVSRALEIKSQLEPVIEKSAPDSAEVRKAMQDLVGSDGTLAYLQLADSATRVVNSTSGAPKREKVPLEVVPPAAPEVVRALQGTGEASRPEYVMGVRLSKTERGHLLVGMSTRVLDEQLRQFQEPWRWSSVQITVICVAILAVFSAYIVLLHERTRGLAAQLHEESRLVYVGTLAASIAHEVRNPLSSMKMNVQMIERKLAELADPAQADYFRGKVERIKGEIERLEDSVNHFLAFSRPAPLQPRPSRLADVVDSVLELLQPQCQAKGVQLVRRHARDLPPVALDPRQFVQAIQNLVLNALQALGRGGTITVSTEATPGGVAVSVADNGPGIPKEVQQHIFEVFFTTREGGTGLGLNIVSRIVEEHHGKLSVESEPGKGATFRIELPRAAPPPDPDERA